MEVRFATRKMQKRCSETKELNKLGARDAKVLKRRLAELKAADSLEDMKSVPAARCHELTGDRRGTFAVDLVHPRRLTFKPIDYPPPLKPDGGFDWKRIKTIQIEEIVDYH